MAWVLCKKEDVISLNPAAASMLSDFWSDSVEDMIRKYLQMPNLGKQVEVTERHSGTGGSILIVKRPPVVSVSSLCIGDIPYAASEYMLRQNGVELVGQVFLEGSLNVSITYVSGSELDENGAPIIDPTIRFTAAAMLAAIVNYRGRGGSDASIKWGGADQKEGEPSPNVHVGLTSHLVTIMRRMLKRGKVLVG